MEKHEVDIANGSFLAKWPTWLRWVLFIPAAGVGAVIASILYSIFFWLQSNVLGIEHATFFTDLIKSAVFSLGFVYFGAYMAPRYQFIVSIFLLIIFAMVLGISVLLSFSEYSSVSPFKTIIHVIVSLIVGGCTAFNIKSETEKI